MKYFKKIIKFCLFGLLGFGLLGLLIVLGSYLILAPNLPSIDALKDIRLQVPLRVYTQDAKFIAEFGEMKRTPLRYNEVPELMIQAVLAAEDDRFFTHPGVDYQGILRAAVNLVKTGEKSQGGSTITMQVARNFFLTSEKSYLRKLNEIFLALKIERELTKQEILELYLNKIYLGNRAYGVAAAAQIYYGTTIDQLDITQIAMIAGLPKAPSRYNPIVNPDRALLRRDYILKRMQKLNYIDDEALQSALSTKDNSRVYSLSPESSAHYVAEMVRAYMVEQFGNDAYTSGYSVFTTLNSRLQEVANGAIQKALIDYDTRHGYRGPLQRLDLTATSKEIDIPAILSDIPEVAELKPAMVIATDKQTARVILKDHRVIFIPWEGLSWARQYIDENQYGPEPELAEDIVSIGDVVYIQAMANNQWRLGQVPEVEGALVSLNPEDGAIIALSGGFDFYQSKFNRVTQAKRQPGSNFKPFIYSAALEKGFTTATLINDAPVVFDDEGLESAWRPENYSGKFSGPTRLREALIHSRNLVSIRLLRSIGINYALNYVERFGFDRHDLPKNLSLSLGSGAVTPLRLAAGYAVFANGGYRIEPYFITHILDSKGEIIMQTKPATVCPDCAELVLELEKKRSETDKHDTNVVAFNDDSSDNKMTAEEEAILLMPENIAKRVVPEDNVYLMTSILRDVITRGTGRGARQLGRNDIAGKTGTTNDQHDAWFSGFNKSVVTTSWVGFDRIQSLGNKETGGRAALPMWISYMKEALKGIPEKPLKTPAGLVSVRIDPRTGLLAGTQQADAIFETFRIKDVPTRYAESNDINDDLIRNGGDASEQLY